jgi:hypothetical protein
MNSRYLEDGINNCYCMDKIKMYSLNIVLLKYLRTLLMKFSFDRWKSEHLIIVKNTAIQQS